MTRWFSLTGLLMALTVTVAWAQDETVPTAPGASVEPILRQELDKDTVVPGQPLVLRLTVLVPTWLPSPPVFPSFEAPNVMVRLPERSSGPATERIEGETWSGVTRAYRLYPMAVGDYAIPAQTMVLTYADPDTTNPVTVDVPVAEVRFSARPAPGSEGLDPYIAANALTLEQTLEGEPGNLEPGDAVTRTITATIEGTSPVFIPPLLVAEALEGVNVYPKEPLVTETNERGVLSGTRVESAVYMAAHGGRASVAPVRLEWFNLDTGEIETAEIPAIDFAVRGEPPPPPAEPIDWRAVIGWTVLAILALALAGLVAWRLRPQITAWQAARREARLASEAWAYRQALGAMGRRDLSATLRTVDLWATRLGDQRDVVAAPVRLVLVKLGRGAYGSRPGAGSGDWPEAERALKAAHRAHRQASTRSGQSGQAVLPPLNPTGSGG